MIEELTHVMVQSGASWVLWLLVGLSVISLAIGLERAVAFRRLRADAAEQVRALRQALRRGGPTRAREEIRAWKGVAATVVRAGLEDAGGGSEASEEAMAAALGLERARLSHGLLFLGTVGNNAPFVGLLGTVIGVVGAFNELGKPQALEGAMAATSALAPERVMATIAEALVATAVGLLVAIPAVAAFNYFQGRVNAALEDARTLGHVLLSYLRAEGLERPLQTRINERGEAREEQDLDHRASSIAPSHTAVQMD